MIQDGISSENFDLSRERATVVGWCGWSKFRRPRLEVDTLGEGTRNCDYNVFVEPEPAIRRQPIVKVLNEDGGALQR